MASDQQFCLKWNNHRSTLFSVFDSLLEEESLVDVTLSAEGQFIRAHRVILSACSPYFKTLFRASYLNDKHPVIFMKDVDFDNLKALVEYMYKGEANVPQHMLQSFIRTAESLQIRGLAECATKQLEAEQLQQNLPPVATPPQSLIGQTPPILPSQQQASLAASAPHHSTPSYKGDSGRKRGPLAASPIVGGPQGSGGVSSGGGILAKHLSKLMDGAVGPPLLALPPPQFDFHPESLLPRHPNHLPPPPMKKPRKSEPRPSGSNAGSNHLNSTPPPPPPCLKDLPSFLPMNREDRLMMMKGFPGGFSPPKSVTPRMSNNNNYDHEEGPLKIDEDIDPGKENRMDSPISNDDDIAEIDVSNGASSDEEEEAMPGPGAELADPPRIINPWTGEAMKLSVDQDDNSAQDDTGMVGWPNMQGDFSETTHSPYSTLSATPPSPNGGQLQLEGNRGHGASGTAGAGSGDTNSPNKSVRLKRLNSAQQHTVYSLCQTPEGVKYRCTACSRCFNLKCTLLRHVRHQHQGRFVPHPCGHCGQVFKRTDHLKVHMKKIHNISASSRQRNISLNSSANAAQSPTVAAAVASMAHQQPVPPHEISSAPSPPIS